MVGGRWDKRRRNLRKIWFANPVVRTRSWSRLDCEWVTWLRKHAKQDLVARGCRPATVRNLSNRIMMWQGYLNEAPPRQYQPDPDAQAPATLHQCVGKPANFVFKKTIRKLKFCGHRLAKAIAYKRLKLRRARDRVPGARDKLKRYENPKMVLQPELFDFLKSADGYRQEIFAALVNLNFKQRLDHCFHHPELQTAMGKIIDKRFAYIMKEIRQRVMQTVRFELSFFVSRMEDPFPATEYIVQHAIYGEQPLRIKMNGETYPYQSLHALRSRIDVLKESADQARNILIIVAFELTKSFGYLIQTELLDAVIKLSKKPAINPSDWSLFCKHMEHLFIDNRPPEPKEQPSLRQRKLVPHLLENN